MPQGRENEPQTEAEWQEAAKRAGWDFEDGRPPEEHGVYQDGLEQRTRPPKVQ